MYYAHVRTQLISLIVWASVIATVDGCSPGNIDPPPQNEPDASVPPPPPPIDAPDLPRCGNGDVNPGEDCDSANLDGATCQSQGYEGGVLACNPGTCTFDTSNCYTCGDGRVSGTEQCDGQDLGGATCETAGYAGGTLGCDVQACTFDVSQCNNSQTLQNHDGACDLVVGCTPAGNGDSGNPQSVVECFNSGTLAPPFRLTQVTYSVGTTATVPAPDALNVDVYTWRGIGVPGSRIASFAVTAADVTQGPHTITLANPVEITTPDFCVGVSGSNLNDGFMMSFSQTSTVSGAAWIDAVTCDVNGFALVTEVTDPPLEGNWCMSATIDK